MQTKANYIPDVYRTLIGHLSTRGLMPREMEKLMEDVFRILCKGGTFTMSAINRTLESMGWREGIVDKISFQLIIHLFEKEDSYEVQEASLH